MFCDNVMSFTIMKEVGVGLEKGHIQVTSEGKKVRIKSEY